MEAWLAGLADGLAANRGPEDRPGSISFLLGWSRTRRTSCRSQGPGGICFRRRPDFSSARPRRLRLGLGFRRQFDPAHRGVRGNWCVFVALLPAQARDLRTCRSHDGDVRAGDLSGRCAHFSRPILDCHHDRRHQRPFARVEDGSRKVVESFARGRDPGVYEVSPSDGCHSAHSSRPHVWLVWL